MDIVCILMIRLIILPQDFAGLFRKLIIDDIDIANLIKRMLSANLLIDLNFQSNSNITNEKIDREIKCRDPINFTTKTGNINF